MKRVPILPTLLVLIAVGVMLRLGFWQIDRLHQKEAMLASFHANESDHTVHPWAKGDLAAVEYGRVSGECVKVRSLSAQAGRNAAGETGWAHIATCDMAGGAPAKIVLGWSAQPALAQWSGGAVTGTYVQRDTSVIFADPPLAGLQANANPDPRDIPNNHLAYAVQWFLFAGIALVIYGLALRKRWQGA